MRKIRVRDLDEWPPQSGGPFAQGKMRGVSPEEAIVRTFIRREARGIRFACLLGGASYVYAYEAKTEIIAEQLESIIKDNVGKSLRSLGECEIEEEMTES